MFDPAKIEEAQERARAQFDQWLAAQLKIAELAGFRFAVASMRTDVIAAMIGRADQPEFTSGYMMLGPGESPPKREGVRWTIYEQVGGEWRGRTA